MVGGERGQDDGLPSRPSPPPPGGRQLQEVWLPQPGPLLQGKFPLCLFVWRNCYVFNDSIAGLLA